MTNKLVVIINSLKVPKIKKILLYEMKFLVPNYSCLQNPWLGGYRPQIPVLSVLCTQLNLLNPPPRTKFPDTPLTLYPSEIYRRFGGTYGLFIFTDFCAILLKLYTPHFVTCYKRPSSHGRVSRYNFFCSYFKMVSVTSRQFCVAACSNIRSLKGSECHTFYSHHHIFIYR